MTKLIVFAVATVAVGIIWFLLRLQFKTRRPNVSTDGSSARSKSWGSASDSPPVSSPDAWVARDGSAPRVRFRDAADFEARPTADQPASDQQIDKDVQFTVFRPATILPQRWYPLLAFAHLSKRPADAPADELDPLAEVQRQASIILSDQPAEFESTKLDRAFSVPRKGTLRFVPLVEGCEFNPPSQSVMWRKTVHKVEFEMMASAAFDGQAVEGQMTVYLGNFILTEIPLRITVDSRYVAPKSQRALFEEASAEPYRKIFPSYSHKDTEIVEDFENYVQSLGDQYLRDVRVLRSGEVWSEKLEEAIREASVFQLFWSWNSMPSKFVRQEWEYALGLNRPAKFIRPVYWEDPLPEQKPDLPPEALRRLHFYKFPGHGDERLSAVAAPVIPTPTRDVTFDWPSDSVEGSVPTTGLSNARQASIPLSMDVYASAPTAVAGAPLALIGAAILVVTLAGLALGAYWLWFRNAPIPTPVGTPTPTPITSPMPTVNPTPTVSPQPKPTATATVTPKPTPPTTPTATPSPFVKTGPSAVSIALDPTMTLKAKGDIGSYYLTVRNESSGPITDVELSEALPLDLDYVSSVPGAAGQSGTHLVRWHVTKIGQNAGPTIKVTVRLTRDLKPGENIATQQTIEYIDEHGNKMSVKSQIFPVRNRGR